MKISQMTEAGVRPRERNSPPIPARRLPSCPHTAALAWAGWISLTLHSLTGGCVALLEELQAPDCSERVGDPGARVYSPPLPHQGTCHFPAII